MCVPLVYCPRCGTVTTAGWDTAAKVRSRGCPECGADELEQVGFGPFGKRERASAAGPASEMVTETRQQPTGAGAEPATVSRPRRR